MPAPFFRRLSRRRMALGLVVIVAAGAAVAVVVHDGDDRPVEVATANRGDVPPVPDGAGGGQGSTTMTIAPLVRSVSESGQGRAGRR
jgi:hypothetical protein